MLQQLQAVLPNDLQLLAELHDGIQLLCVRSLDQFSFEFLQFGGRSPVVLLNIVKFTLPDFGFGRAELALGSLEDAHLELILALAHLA